MQCLLFIRIMTLVFKPWKIVTPFNSKHTTLLAMLAFGIPPKITREKMIMRVMLSYVPPCTNFLRFKKIGTQH